MDFWLHVLPRFFHTRYGPDSDLPLQCLLLIVENRTANEFWAAPSEEAASAFALTNHFALRLTHSSRKWITRNSLAPLFSTILDNETQRLHNVLKILILKAIPLLAFLLRDCSMSSKTRDDASKNCIQNFHPKTSAFFSIFPRNGSMSSKTRDTASKKCVKKFSSLDLYFF